MRGPKSGDMAGWAFADSMMCVMFYGLLTNFDLICYRAEGSVPYLIPVGGSNAMGVWGYIEAFREMVDQVRGKLFLLYLIWS